MTTMTKMTIMVYGSIDAVFLVLIKRVLLMKRRILLMKQRVLSMKQRVLLIKLMNALRCRAVFPKERI